MKVFCILGDQRVHNSKSPDLHITMLRRYGISATYVPFAIQPDKIEKAVQGLKALNISGANVTVPYKEKIIPFLDEISEVAHSIGAINTLVHRDDRIIGYNTDYSGFLDCLKDMKCNTEESTFLVVGTGGVARAILYALKRQPAKKVLLTGRNSEKVYKLAERYGAHARSWDTVMSAPFKADILINATSVSSPTEAPSLKEDLKNLKLKDCKMVLDVNYGRKENIWQDFALRNAANFYDGIPLLSYQARRSFFLWTNIEVEKDEFKRILDEMSGQ